MRPERFAAATLTIACCLTLVLLPSTSSAFHSVFEPNGSIPQRANGRSNQPPDIRAHYLDGGEISVDGKLDDAAWQGAESGGGFIQADPNRGDPPSEETVFKVVYDEDSLYFGVACFEKDVHNVSSSLSRRDNIDNSDVVSIYVDPYHDKNTGYNFRVNPEGVQMDQYIFNDGTFDPDWNAVWEAETYQDEKGWYVEVRIPFSSVRYRPSDDMTWGLQVYRWMHGRGEDTGWVTWDRNTRGFISRFGTLSGLQGVPAPRQLEILPYFVSRATDPSINTAEDGELDEVSRFQNMGADLKYGVTADLTLNGTVQPDFGQVEADPATLNLSPFETFYEEKRPFFIEGSRFFEHPDFNLVYTRRIGTGDENSRIRYAGKLTGKTAGDVTLAGMFAATDLTSDGQAHNVFKSGTDQSYFGVVRLGREFDEGNHSFNAMQTAVVRNNTVRYEDDSDRVGRDGYTTGLDGTMNFHDRMYQVQGSWVYTVVDPIDAVDDDGDPLGLDELPRYGSGGALDFQKIGGKYRGGLFGRYEGDKLDPNDMGILSAPDEISASTWLQRRFNSDDNNEAYINQGNLNFNAWQSWFYAGREITNSDDGDIPAGSYGRGKPQSSGGNINGWFENKNRWSAWFGVWHDFRARDKFNTRGGPIMKRPAESGVWIGMNTDWRKSLKADTEINFGAEHDIDDNKPFDPLARDQGYFFNWNIGVNWVQNSRLNHRLSFFFRRTREDDQWVDNIDGSTTGIGGTSYVFGRLDQKIADITLRSNVLFNRNQSLELYVQPFVTVGNFYDAKELAAPDSYEFQPYTTGGYDISQEDFELSAVNLNAVYRWEYRPGSTLYLVWTHSRLDWEQRADFNSGFQNNLSPGSLWNNEPENTFLVKLSYWFSV